MISRNRALDSTGNETRALLPGITEHVFDHNHRILAEEISLTTILFQCEDSETGKKILYLARLIHQLLFLQTISEFRTILASTITLEVGEIVRFPSVGDYSSYCQRVKMERFSNRKKLRKSKKWQRIPGMGMRFTGRLRRPTLSSC